MSSVYDLLRMINDYIFFVQFVEEVRLMNSIFSASQILWASKIEVNYRPRLLLTEPINGNHLKLILFCDGFLFI